MKTYIYNENLELIETLNYSVQDFSKNPLKYPLWKDVYYYSEKEYKDKNLIKIENGAIVEKTTEELKIEKILDLVDGEVIRDGKLIVIEKPIGYLKYVFNRELEIWEEGATKEEIKSKHRSNMAIYKEDLKNNGYVWIDKDGIEHNQKYREKDENKFNTVNGEVLLAMLVRQSNPSYPIQSTEWFFNDDDALLIDETQFLDLKTKGVQHLTKCYHVEGFLNSIEPDLTITYEDFKEVYDNYNLVG